jgi:L-threonylcarbamoyladenylate synthase
VELILNPATADLQRAARSILQGNLVVFPTETVYGLGADASNTVAMKRIFHLKNRPRSNPLIVHLFSTKNISYWAKELPDYAQTLAETFWPGPITLILKRSDHVLDLVTGGQSSIGIRIPSNHLAQDLLLEFEKIGGLGIAAPSANIYGEVSSTSARSAQKAFGNKGIKGDLILDGGTCEYGIESTIIDCTEASPIILRPGVITPELIEGYTGIVCGSNNSDRRKVVPGMATKHYAPKTKILINQIPKAGDGLIADFGIVTPPGVIRIAAPKNLFDFAKDLYSSFQLADSLQVSSLSVYLPVVESGIAIAIRDRVLRAANRN